MIVLVLGAIIFLLLTGAPYGRDEEKPVTQTQNSTETISEGDSSSAATATLVDDEPPPVASTTTTTTPAEPPPVIREEPRTTTPPPARPREDVPPVVAVAPPPARVAEISFTEAVNVLRGFITSRDYYGIGTACTGISNVRYHNVGYTLEVHDTCGGRLLGLWRVDAKTREIFRQRPDGRYLPP